MKDHDGDTLCTWWPGYTPDAPGWEGSKEQNDFEDCVEQNNDPSHELEMGAEPFEEASRLSASDAVVRNAGYDGIKNVQIGPVIVSSKPLDGKWVLIGFSHAAD